MVYKRSSGGVFRAYVDEHSSQAASLARENTIVAEIAKEQQLDVIQSRRLRLSVRHDLADHEAHYNRLRERFLMLDLFPANKARFGLTYERCVSPQDPRVAEE